MSVESWMATGAFAIVAACLVVATVFLVVCMRQGNQEEDRHGR